MLLDHCILLSNRLDQHEIQFHFFTLKKKKKEENPLIDSVRSKYTKILNIEKKENDELSKSAVDY